MVTDQRGEIEPGGELGIFGGDTRLVSTYKLYVNGQPCTLLPSSAVQYDAARIELVNPPLATDLGDVAPGQIGLTLRRRIRLAIHEDLDVVSYADRPVHFQLE